MKKLKKLSCFRRDESQKEEEDRPTQLVKTPETPPKPSTAQEAEPSRPSLGQISVSLWHEAFDSIKLDKSTSELFNAYTKALFAMVVGAPVGSKDVTNLIPDEAEGRETQMKKVIGAGLKRTERSAAITRGLGTTAEWILKSKKVIDLAVGSIPQAAIPWAAVSICLEANLDGIEYVSSRMQWYCQWSEVALHPEQVEPKDGRLLDNVRFEIRKKVLGLYKAILIYQMKSVCTYYESQLWVFLRGLVNLDGWDASLEAIQTAEEKLRIDYND
ncbi:hypothetical protein BJ170DRAFT_687516 [Xylariales sp. AK1849]|nr:hypothetical protein BJ170DRAFT_687516 [Xylariales sp. AK1849]